ncbi:MAG: redoxin domain-containing protein [Planctomycetota bacterium]
MRPYLAFLAAGALACQPAETPSVPADPRLSAALEERAQELDARTMGIGRLVPDLAFETLDGKNGRLSDFRERPLVIAVRDVGCPVSKRTAPALARIEDEFTTRGVAFLFLNLSEHNTPAEIRADNAQHGFDGPTVHELEPVLGRELGATTTTEVFVLDESRTLVYRGAIDDQVARGSLRAEASHHWLRDALLSTLAHEKLLVAATSAPGCRLGLEPRVEASATPTYHREVARLLRDNCVECHRSGGVAPFALETYAQAKGRRVMMRDVVEAAIMPPWFAAGDGARWKNDRRLSSEAKATLLAWIDAGTPEGDPAETPCAYVYPDGWRIGEPDIVFEMTAPYTVPAEGLVAQRYFEVGPEVPEDLWIQRLEVRPGELEVVHHVTVSYQLPAGQGDFDDELRRTLLPWARSDNAGWVFLFGYLPGKGPRSYPEGIARFLPKGARLRFDMHYTPSGTAVSDQTRLGLVLAKKPPEIVAESRNLWNPDILIPPNEPHAAFTREFPILHDVVLRSLTPHMHLRGKSMVADLLRTDGSEERLIEIPAWDQDWQFNHVLREPIFLAAGSRVRVTAVFDNSAANEANPDPSAWVKDGPLTTDEMMSLVIEWLRPRLVE